MKNKIFFYLLMIIICWSCGSTQSSTSNSSPTQNYKPTKVVVTWLSPTLETAELDGAELMLEFIVETGVKVKKEDIAIWNNGAAGKKADEIDFSKMGEKKAILKMPITLVRGNNKVQVVMAQPNRTNRFIKSDPLNIEFDGSKISMRKMETGEGIFWRTPAWNPSMIVQDERTLPMKVLINSNEDIRKDQIFLIHQGVAKVPLSEDSRLKRITGTTKYELTNNFQFVQSGKNRIEVRADRRYAKPLTSDPLVFNFTPFKPNVHLLSVGTQTNLQYTPYDARDFAEAFSSQGSKLGGRLFNEVNIDTLLATSASASNIRKKVQRFQGMYKDGTIGKKDILVLFLSSHGFIGGDRQFRLQGEDYDTYAWKETSVSYQEDILAILNEIPCKKLIFIDACYSGEGAKGDGDEVDQRIEALNRRLKGVTTIVSSQGNEASYEDRVWQNGAFTEAILEVFNTSLADTDKDHFITINEMWFYIRNRVPQLVQQVKGKPQHPVLKVNELGDVAIFYRN